MQLIIQSNSKDLDKEFIYVYLPDYIYKAFLLTVDETRLKEFDEFFDIDSLEILTKALKNLLITKNGMYEYIFKVNKVLKYDNVSISSWINVITYGNREVKGYPILIDLFKSISENIKTIYKEWENGH